MEKKKLTFTKVISTLLFLSVSLLILSEVFFVNNKNEPEVLESEASVEITRQVTPEFNEKMTEKDSIQIMINKSHPLDEEYVPEDLENPYITSLSDTVQLRKEASEQLVRMKNEAKNAGITLIVTDSYRSFEHQNDLYLSYVSLVGETKAETLIAKPGYSEHQTGLAVDFTDEKTNSIRSSSFAKSKEGKWLKKNAYKFGFILRYPEGKESITGYTYMPWHYRYVGIKTAKAMRKIDKNLTLEEYFEAE